MNARNKPALAPVCAAGAWLSVMAWLVTMLRPFCTPKSGQTPASGRTRPAPAPPPDRPPAAEVSVVDLPA